MEPAGPNRTTRTRDDSDFSYDLSNAIYGQFPSCATSTSPRRSRAPSPHTSAKTAKTANKRKATTPIELNFCRQKISPNRTSNATTPTWLSPQANKLRNMATVHQSVLLNFTAGSENNTESEMWMLPELDDWEADSDTEGSSSSSSSSSSSLQYSSSPATPTQQSTQQQPDLSTDKEWSTFLHRAAKSNLERLRARLEAEGWDFAGARFAGQSHGVQQQAPCQSEDRLDEEFDVVVVLSAIEAGC
ncbi:hypothetical protein DDE82_006726 [Stemphylium lycopersici]|nr:hypothetical protein DDE82_006726 [Stemphylium lycopersici]